MKKILISILTVTCLSYPSYAESPASPESQGWTSKVINLSWHGSGVKKDMRGVFQRAEGVYSGDAKTSGNVAFTCYGGNFSVNVSLEQIDMGTLFTNTPDSTRRKLKRAYIKINGEPIKSSAWIYMPAMKVYRAREKSTSAKLYNAVIRGSDVEMKSNRSGYVSLNLPAVDTSFKNFGSDCGLGILTKKI